MTEDVRAVNILAPQSLLESAADGVQEPIGDQLFARGVGLAQWTVEKQCGQSVHSGPSGFVQTVASVGGEYADGDQVIDAPDQNTERVMLTYTRAVVG